MISLRYLFGAIMLLCFFLLNSYDSFPRNPGNTNNNTAFRTAIIRLPFHQYYREIGYEVDAEGRAIYQGDIDLGPEHS